MIAGMAETPSTTSSTTETKTTSRPAAKSARTETTENREAVTEVSHRDPAYVKSSVGTPVTFGDIPTTSDGALIPTPGDPRTEPVATAAQSWVPGRVGPRTIPEDATAATITPGSDGSDEVAPGVVLAETPEGLGRVPESELDDPIGENLARIVEDQDAGRPLDSQGRRVDDNGMPLTGRAAVSR